ncbi:hypothetical protein DUI87_17589 [Hirundo rustica rustica]|uniref:C2 domain-containing protein n=1 Tax=Hirundo rustica rustica TaxID=333673 RepID=A0A3M0K492_HIRRU|nr:hypothetical protein DUI87_17589 [Hirundo rustica rustica]
MGLQQHSGAGTRLCCCHKPADRSFAGTGAGSSDPSCLVKVDNEVVARTATVWKSLNPFWGEEITLLLPRGFHSLTIYVLDEDTVGQDDVIGKVSPSHQQILAEPWGVDRWLSLAPVIPDQEVQGEIHLELRVPERGHPRVLRCHLIEATDLAPRDASGSSDPFGRVSCCGHTLETAVSQCWVLGVASGPPGTQEAGAPSGTLRHPSATSACAQQVIKKSRFPHWDEVLEFELPEGELGEAVLSVELWNWDIVGKNDFLGRVEFFLDTLCPGPTRGWFQLLPFPSTTEDQSPEGTALAVLEEVTSGESRQDVATKLVKIFSEQGLAVPLLGYLTTRELARTTDPNTLFRSNSLASKFMEQFMKVVGLPYLHEVLKPAVNRIFEEKKYVELDPSKMELSWGRVSFKGSLLEAQVQESSLELLKGYLGDIVDAIALQTIGNLGLQLGQGKEPWMAPLSAVLLPSVTRVRAFLDALVTVESPEVGEVPVPQGRCQPSATIKGGALHTCPERGVAPLPRLAFKKRHFRLSTQALAYAKTPGGQVLSSIPVEQIRAVEQVDKGTFQHPHVLQVVAQDDTGQLHTTYLQCKVGDPTLPLHPKNPSKPLPQRAGTPCPAASHGHPHGTMGMVPNPAVPRHWLYWEHWDY